MKFFRLIAVSSLASLLIALVACSSDSSSSSSDACNQAKQVSDSCNSDASTDSGASIVITFDATQCANAGDQGRAIAQCIVNNKSNCDCIFKCTVSGGGSC